MSRGGNGEPQTGRDAGGQGYSRRMASPGGATMSRTQVRLTRDDVLSVAETAELLGCSKRHVYGLANRDALPGARRLGARVIVCRPVLEAWLQGDDA